MRRSNEATLLPTTHTNALSQLGREVFTAEEWRELDRLSAMIPLDRNALIDFDDALWGPSLSRIADNRPNAPGTLGIPGHGITRCDVEDRAIFKPLHYCAADLISEEIDELEWRAREVVEMSGLHIEGLLKRIGRVPYLPFGDALLRLIKPQIAHATWQQLLRFKEIHKNAKHSFDHPLGTHLFSVRDAVLSYFVARRLSQTLYPLANLKTDWRF
jgi:hypothetical protein